MIRFLVESILCLDVYSKGGLLFISMQCIPACFEHKGGVLLKLKKLINVSFAKMEDSE